MITRVSIVLIFIGFFLQAQDPSELWHEGFVITHTDDTIKGLLQYDLDLNTIKVDRYTTIETYSSKNLVYFRLFDKSTQQQRQFYTIPFVLPSGFRTPLFFEMLYEGKMSLLAREKIVVETIPATGMYGSTTYYNRKKLIYQFYFFNEMGEIKEYFGKKNEIFDIMYKHKQKMDDFIKTNRLDTDVVKDLIWITAYYNSLL